MKSPTDVAESLLSAGGRSLIAQAKDDGYILLTAVPRLLNEEALRAENKSTSLKLLAEYLGSCNIKIVLKAPGTPNGAAPVNGKPYTNGTVPINGAAHENGVHKTLPQASFPPPPPPLKEAETEFTNSDKVDADGDVEYDGQQLSDEDERSLREYTPGKEVPNFYLRVMAEHRLLTREQEQKLFPRIKAGNASARDFMIKSNLRLVLWLAKRYVNRGVPYEDLISEGNIGLMKAVDKFDLGFNTKFSTYAWWWIRQKLHRATADQGRTIRVPVHTSDALTKLNRKWTELKQIFERDPTNEELAEALDVSPERVAQLRSISAPTSFDLPIGEKEDKTLGDMLPDMRAPDPVAEAHDSDKNRIIMECFSKLDVRQREILLLRYGFADGAPKTLEEIGKRFKITRERIRQIEAKAFRRIRKFLIKPELVEQLLGD